MKNLLINHRPSLNFLFYCINFLLKLFNFNLPATYQEMPLLPTLSPRPSSGLFLNGKFVSEEATEEEKADEPMKDFFETMKSSK